MTKRVIHYYPIKQEDLVKKGEVAYCGAVNSRIRKSCKNPKLVCGTCANILIFGHVPR